MSLIMRNLASMLSLGEAATKTKLDEAACASLTEPANLQPPAYYRQSYVTRIGLK